MSDDRVRFTDDQAAWSKASCVKQKYWDDEALRRCIPKGPRRSPLVHAVYYMRHKLIDTILKVAINQGFKQFLILGAGTDTTFWRLEMSKFNDIQWFEIDFPHNLKAKEAILCEFYGKSENYHPVPCDLRDMAACGRGLSSSGFDFSLSTLVLSEVVLAYLSAKHSAACVEWIASKIPGSLLVEFEQFQPNSSFGRIMTSHFDKLGSPLQSIAQLPTLKSREDRAKNFRHHFGTPFFGMKLALPGLEPFDEFEALHATLKHYYVAFSTNNHDELISLMKSELEISDTKLKLGPDKTNWKSEKRSQTIGRAFSAFYKNKESVTFHGGIGYSQDQAPHGVQCVELENLILLYGGRRSPNKPCTKWTQINRDSMESVEIEVLVGELGNVYRAATVAVEDMVFQFGGRGVGGQFLSKLVRLKKLNSEVVAVDLPPAGQEVLPELASASLAYYDEKIILVGGLRSDGSVSSKVFQIRLSEDSYEIVDQFDLGFGIYGHRCLVSGNQLLLVGGINDCFEGDEFVYRLNLNERKVTAERIDFGGDIVLMHGHHIDGSGEEIEIIGGGNNCFSFGTYLNPTITSIKQIES